MIGLGSDKNYLEFGDGGLYWQSSWSPLMSQSLTLMDWKLIDQLLSLLHFLSIINAFFASLKILGLLFCPHCRWQRRVPMDGKPPNWHQKCDPTTFGCSRESWSSFLPVLLWIFSSQMHNNRATEPQVPESRGLVNAAGDEDRLLARVERHGCNVSVVTLDIMWCVLSWPWT